MSDTAKLTRGGIRGHLVTQTTPMIIGVAAIMSVSYTHLTLPTKRIV